MKAILEQKNKVAAPSFIRRELTALFFLGLGIFIYLSLFTYHPSDPSLFGLSSSAMMHNGAGIVGAYLSDLLFFLFGMGAYLPGLYFITTSTAIFAGKKESVGSYEIPLFFFFVMLMSILFELTLKIFTVHEAALQAGGIIGSVMGQWGKAYVGRIGMYLVVVCGALIAVVKVYHLSLKDTAQGFMRAMAWLGFRAKLAGIFAYRKTAMAAKTMAQKCRDYRAGKSTVVKEVPKNPFVRERTPHQEAPAVKKIERKDPLPVAAEPMIYDREDKKLKKALSLSPQLKLQNMSSGYELPPIQLLDLGEANQEAPVDQESLKMNARLLEKKLLDFDVEGRVTEIHPGPVITMYEFEPAPGVKLSKISNLVDDLSMAMGGRSVRIVSPLPNKAAIGIEIPNNTRESVWLKDVIADEKFQKTDAKLMFAVGKDVKGIPMATDLAKMPHLLVAGSTGSGKSVAINGMILSLLYKASPEDVRLIMVDPKMLELSIYDGIPHLLLPVVTDPKKATLALRWAVHEMERRYKLLADVNARHILNYNKLIEKKDFVSKQAQRINSSETQGFEPGEEVLRHDTKIPYIVIIIDELADLMVVSSRDVEESIMRLAQMARAAGIHLILATQRPSVDVLTGVIKANFPARISFKVSSKHDSRTVLDTIGAERLLGAGDMLFIPPGTSKMTRVHGAYITETEVARVVEFIKQQAEPVYDDSILKPLEAEAMAEEAGGGEGADDLYDQAVSIVAETKQASISMIQRKLRIGYNRAARMIEQMETDGIVSPPSGAGHRQVLVSSFETG